MKKKIISLLLLFYAYHATAQHFTADIIKLSLQRDSLIKHCQGLKCVNTIDSVGALLMYYADYEFYSYALKIAEDSFAVQRLKTRNIELLTGMRYYPWYKVKNSALMGYFKNRMYFDATRLLIRYHRFNLKELMLIELPYFHSGICFELQRAILEAGGKWDRDYDCFLEDQH